jgi:hypothetical protein
MEVKVDLIKGELKLEGISIYELFEDMSEEDKDSLTGMFTWNRIFKAAVKRLTGESEDYCDSDKKLTLEVLAKMERHLLSGYKWNILTNLESLAQNAIAHEHIYWAMYHEKNEGLRRVFREWLDAKEIKSNYMSKYPSYLEFKRFVDDKLEEFGGNQDNRPTDERVQPFEEINRVIKELEDAEYQGNTHLKRDMDYVANALRWVLYKDGELPKG